ncbi:putative helicase MAGATAMA 3 [Bienertia sinuspersici]
MEKKSTSGKKEVGIPSLLEFVFSWSIKDVLNKNLYKKKVKKIPYTFSSTSEYLSSFQYPLIEETRAELSSGLESVAQSPACEISELRISKNFKPPKSLYYEISTKKIMDVENSGGHYELQSGDLIALTSVRPQSIEDLIRPNEFFLLVAFVKELNGDKPSIEILASQEVEPQFRSKKHERIFATFLMNITTNLRIWISLNSDPKSRSMDLIQKVLQYDSSVDDDDDEDYAICIKDKSLNNKGWNVFDLIGSFGLDESQKKAILSSISMRKCSNKNNVKLIWGPPGTGKTKTVASLLFVLLELKCRTLTCAPTNIAVVQVAKRLVSLFLDSIGEFDTYGLGDIVLFGNEVRMKIKEHDQLVDVFLDYRKKILEECLAPVQGWKHTLESMKCLLENPHLQYNAYLQQRKVKDKVRLKVENGSTDCLLRENKKKNRRKEKRQDSRVSEDIKMTFEEFFMKTYNSLANRLVYCFKNIYSHLPTSILPVNVAKEMIRLISLLNTVKNARNKVCRFPEHVNLLMKREEILCIFKYLSGQFPKLDFKGSIQDFCLSNASVIFCTASSSLKVRENIEFVIIDEAAQLKECESTIPLQLPGLRNVVLIGDDRQLPAMVQSKALGELNFGRSLFQRLSTLGKKKHLLKIQYRMHPSISLFPNKEFYESKIIDALNVKEKSYSMSFLEGGMYGSYSFINVSGGKEDFEKGHSPRNMKEAVVVDQIIAKLFKGHDSVKKKLSVGVISPYKGQVCLIEEKIGKKYVSYKDKFTVSIRSVDGFQGGEEDIIIISTVRCNGNGSVGFLCNHQRTNVALTRARYCLWIVGNWSTLANSGSVWKNVVIDAKTRGCLFDADDDKLDLEKARTRGLVKNHETTLKLDFFGSLKLRGASWKVIFSDTFKESIGSIRSEKLHKQVQEIVKNIADGWINPNSKEVVNNAAIYGKAFELLEQYKVDEHLSLFWTVDILKEDSKCTQVIKVWDILPASRIPFLAKELNILFDKYTLDFMKRCKYKCFEGNSVAPMSWPLHAVVGVNDHLSDQFSTMSLRGDQEELISRSVRNNMKARSGVGSRLRRRRSKQTQ